MNDTGASSTDWLAGGGDLGELIRSLDWSATSLGAREHWPASLRTIVNLVIETRSPMALVWGRDRLLIYNDAYGEIAGERHPAALGRPCPEVWPEVWHINEPILAAVTERGESVHLEDAVFAIERGGVRRDAYFTLSYSPVRVEDGTIGGTLVILQETTARVAERERLASDHQRVLDTFEHGEACIVLDADYRVVLVNREQERISGKPRATTIGRIIWDVWPDHADPASPFRRAYDEVISERRALTFEEFFAPLAIWIHVRVYPMADGGLAAFFHDATLRRTAEEELRTSEARLRALTLASSDVVYRMSPDWREMRNLSSGRFLAETVEPDANWMEKYIHPEDRHRVQAAIDDACRRGETFELEHRVVTSDGDLGWTHSRAIPLRNSAGRIVEWFGVASDVTARKRAEEALRAGEADARARAAELERLVKDRQLALNAARMGWWHYDPATRTARFDERYVEIFGVSGSERANDDILELIHPDDLPRVLAAVEAALDPDDPRRYATEYRIRRPDGAERWIAAHGAATFETDAGPRRATSLVGTVADITDRRRAEDALRESRQRLERYSEDLEREVAARTIELVQRQQELEHARDAAEQASRAKSAFLANMSHEIRTPLNAVLGLTHLVERATADPVQRERLGKVQGAARHLLGVISDVLDLSKIEAGKLVLEHADFSLDDVLSKALEIVAEPARLKRLDLRVEAGDAPRRLVGDPTRLSQALINLLSNAVKFTAAGWIRVRVRTLSGDGAAVSLRFEVTDTGPGVAPAAQSTLFEAFQQGDVSTTRRHGGTGLGLALTRELAALMDGDVGVDSVEGAGSTFWFTARLSLPQDAATRASGEDTRLEPTESLDASLRMTHAGQRILVAEDNAVNQEVATALLESAGLVVALADDGEEAVRRALGEDFDAVLMDVQMPTVDGLEATRRIRAAGRVSLPIVAMTASAFAEDRDACLAAGMSDHLTKPVAPDALYATLLRWLPPKRPAGE